MREKRAGKIGELRFDEDDGRHYFTARIVNYEVPDSYRTSWAPGVFTRSLEQKLPTAVFAHQWDRPIGKVVSYQEQSDGLDVTVRMSDLEVNPDAKRMYYHLKDQEIEEFSFAFERVNEEPDPNHRGVARILEASLDEVSPVLKGSVPGTRVLAMRSGDEPVDKAFAAELLIKFHSGEIDLADALQALKVGAGESVSPLEFSEADTQSEDDTPEVVSPDPDEEDVLEKLSVLSRGK